jgi:hypothetical protein
MRKTVLFSTVAWMAVASIAAAHAGTKIGTTGTGDGNHQRTHAGSAASKSGDGAGGKSGAGGGVSTQGGDGAEGSQPVGMRR